MCGLGVPSVTYVNTDFPKKICQPAHLFKSNDITYIQDNNITSKDRFLRMYFLFHGATVPGGPGLPLDE